MRRLFTKTMILTAALSAALCFQSFSAVIYGPGIAGITSNSGQAGPGGGSTSETTAAEQSSSGTSTVGAAPAAGTAQSPAQSQSSAPASAAAPSSNSGTAVATSIVVNSSSTNTGCASNATIDPIMGNVPQIHAQVLKMDGNLTDGFTTNEGMFEWDSDGMTGLKLRYEYSIGDVYYRVYTDQHGWSKWAMNEMITPYSGDQAKVTAFQIRTNGHTRNLYDVYYRAVLNDGTTLGWAHDGQSAGTIGTGKYIKKIQLALWTHGAQFNQSTSGRFLASNEEGVIMGTNGSVKYSTWNGQPYTGWGYDTANNKYYFINSEPVTGWQTIGEYKYYFDSTGKVVTDLEPIMGKQSSYQIKINKSMKTMTIYAKGDDGKYNIPFKVILNTIGPDTPIGTFKTYEKYRWKFMHDDIYCQFLLRFKNGFLLHSIIYQPEPNSHSLVASTYNYLGKNQSDGCVRMKTGDAAWVYENCGTGTTVTIYEDEWVTGPFDRPAIQQGIPFDQNYDPTDPVILSEQAQDTKAAAEAQAEASSGVEAPPTEVAQ